MWCQKDKDAQMCHQNDKDAQMAHQNDKVALKCDI
jgi:hypothetical protein